MKYSSKFAKNMGLYLSPFHTPTRHTFSHYSSSGAYHNISAINGSAVIKCSIIDRIISVSKSQDTAVAFILYHVKLTELSLHN